MINTLLDISGSARPVAAVHNIASSQNSLARKAAYKAEVAKVERQQDLGVDKTSLVAAVKKLNDFVAPALQTIQFELDQQTERM
ncbi:MAG: flagellar biosynthesis protein FlaG, partial [Methylotenera sp.]|nr:flagellar biosynthesis protein FlaG [Methylotenera sp.]